LQARVVEESSWSLTMKRKAKSGDIASFSAKFIVHRRKGGKKKEKAVNWRDQ